MEHKFEGEYLHLTLDGKTIELSLPMQLHLMQIMSEGLKENTGVRTCSSFPLVPMSLSHVQLTDIADNPIANGIVSRGYEFEDKYIFHLQSEYKLIIHKRNYQPVRGHDEEDVK